MNIFIALLMGLVQGLCEFLPVSSSGHLVLLQNVFGISEGALFFDTMLHVGTLVAVVVVYRKQLWALIKHPVQKRMGLFIAATAVTAVLAIVFKDSIEAAYSGRLLGVGFLVTSLVLMLTERIGKSAKKNIEDMSFPAAMFVGLMQGVAILPGISRSGSTIAASMFMGLKRKDAAEFSFIMSIPPILGSVVLNIPDVIQSGLGDVNWLMIILGMIVAGVSGYFAIRVMIRFVTTRKLTGFAIYTGVLGALVLLDQFVFNIFFANPLA